MKRLAPILGVLVVGVLLGAGVVTLVGGAGPGAVASASGDAGDPDLLGGYGGLGGGGGASGASGVPPAEMPHLDAGLGAIDAGEGAPDPLVPSEPEAVRLDPPVELAPSVTFPAPRTVEDEYDSANMIWSMIEARREQARAELAEARRTGDQALSARLAHQLELLELGDHRLEGIVHDLESQRAATAPVVEDTAHAEGAEGSAPPTPPGSGE